MVNRAVLIASLLVAGLLTSCSREPQFPDKWLPESTNYSEKRIPADVVEMLRNADRFVLYSLSPARKPTEPNGFHGYPILGNLVIADRKVRTELVDELIRANSDFVDKYGIAVECFEPRHGIRLQSGGRTIDLVICFECEGAQLFTNQGRSGFGVSRFPEKFNEILSKAGIHVAPLD